MRKISIIIFLITLGMCPSFVNAQDAWSLEDCIKYALDNNIQIQQEKLQAMISETNFNETKASVYPSLNASANQRFTFGRSVDNFTNEFTNTKTASNGFGVGAQIDLFRGLRKVNSIKRDRFYLLAGLQNVEKVKNDISLNVAATYLQILYNKELLKITQEQAEVDKQQVERTGKMVDAGRLAKGELLEVQSQLAQSELNIVTSENDLKNSYLTLTQLLELESAKDFEIANPGDDVDITEKVLFAVDSIYAVALNALPEVKAADYMVKGAERSLDVSKSSAYPSLSMSAGYSTGYSNARKKFDPVTQTSLDYSFGDQVKDNASKYIGFNLNVPIFNNLRVYSSVERSKINLKKAEKNKELVQNELYKNIQTAHNQALAAHKSFLATTKALSSAEEAFKYSQQKFNVGLITSVEYYTAKNQVARAKMNMLQTKFDYVFRIAVLDHYMGNPIKI